MGEEAWVISGALTVSPAAGAAPFASPAEGSSTCRSSGRLTLGAGAEDTPAEFASGVGVADKALIDPVEPSPEVSAMILKQAREAPGEEKTTCAHTAQSREQRTENREQLQPRVCSRSRIMTHECT